MGKSTVFTALGETKESQHDPFDATYAMIELRQHTIGRTVQMSRRDDIGIRKVFWVDRWPTISTPLTVSFRADDYRMAIGKQLETGFSNIGDRESVVACDDVCLKVIETVLSRQ